MVTIVVADFGNHRLQVLTADCAFVATVGTRGSQQRQFDHPMGVACSLQWKYFYRSAMVTIVSRSSILTSATRIALADEGPQPGELRYPRGIAIDIDGMVSRIADTSHLHRIQTLGTHSRK